MKSLFHDFDFFHYHILLRFIERLCDFHFTDGIHHVHSFKNFSKYRMMVIQPWVGISVMKN